MKKQLGQYYTANNPFEYDLFKEWSKNIRKDDVLLEPFAGSNNLVTMVGLDNKWDSYDIEPQHKDIKYNDSIENFPIGYRVCITNPPYLAKVSASRNKLAYPNTDYADLYMLCLEKMLNNCDYVAAIIPESFITQNLFVERLYGVISLNIKMFDDTDCPVCLALFSPSPPCVKMYIGNQYIGTLQELKKYNLEEYNYNDKSFIFNHSNGNIGIKCLDNTIEDSICFCKPEEIKQNKPSNRAYTIVYSPYDIDIDKCNEILKEYREKTKDVFLTAFRGLRKDGKYRRRLDFNTARRILNKVKKSHRCYIRGSS